MKNSLKYFLLWQNKRNELPVQDDPQADWNQIQSLLDKHMPVKKTGGFKGFKTLPALFITFSAAAMIYLAGNIYSLEKHNHAAKRHFHKGNTMQPGQPFVDSSNTPGSKSSNDSLPSGNQNIIGQDSTGPDGKPIANSPALVASASNSKNNSLSYTNKPAGRLAGANGRTNSTAIVAQNNNRMQKAVTNNKAGQGRGWYSTHGIHSVTPGRGNDRLTKAAGDNKTGSNTISNNKTDQNTAATNAFNNRSLDGPLTPALLPVLKFDMNLNKIQQPSLPGLSSAVNKMHALRGNQTKGNKKDKPGKPQNNKPSNIDWGIMMGVNTSGAGIR